MLMELLHPNGEPELPEGTPPKGSCTSLLPLNQGETGAEVQKAQSLCREMGQILRYTFHSSF